MSTTIVTEPAAVTVEDPFDAALRSWGVDFELDAYVERVRLIDAFVLLGFDLGRSVDLDRVIEHVGP